MTRADLLIQKLLDESVSLTHPYRYPDSNAFNFRITHQDHGNIGYVTGRLDGDTFNVCGVSLYSKRDQPNQKHSNQLGPRAVRALARDLRAHTGARYVTSDSRVTGVRAKANASPYVPRVRIGENLDGNPGYDRPAFAMTSAPVGIPDNPYKDADKKLTDKRRKPRSNLTQD